MPSTVGVMLSAILSRSLSESWARSELSTTIMPTVESFSKSLMVDSSPFLSRGDAGG